MANKTLSAAKKAKKDEFYTQYADIDREMQAYLNYDADHVAAWSKGGETNAANCQMLCKTHNRAKGNK